MLKQCSKCKSKKEIAQFHKNKCHKDGHDNYCKICSKEYKSKSKTALEYHKNYRDRHREKNIKYCREYYKNNKERINAQNTEYCRNRKLNDVSYKIKVNLRRRLNNALKGLNKSNSTLNLIGCSIIALREHLESQFKEGMNWDNYGKWHIDHIRPCSSFDLNDLEQQKICFNYKNLQPLWAEDNLRKGAKIIDN